MSDHNITIYHNPRCSKSRKTLEILQQHNIEPEIIEYQKAPPSTTEIEAILTALDVEPRAVIRTGEAEYKEHNLADESLTREQLVAALHQYPKLLERPIVVTGGKAVIGRPPEAVLSLIE